MLGVETNLYFAENEKHGASFNGITKFAQRLKNSLIDVNQKGINGIDLINKIRSNADLKSIIVFVITAIDNDKK
jgi:response regulator RpfG family c-di-GMP phosphodiesterase